MGEVQFIGFYYQTRIAYYARIKSFSYIYSTILQGRIKDEGVVYMENYDNWNMCLVFHDNIFTGLRIAHAIYRLRMLETIYVKSKQPSLGKQRNMFGFYITDSSIVISRSFLLVGQIFLYCSSIELWRVEE